MICAWCGGPLMGLDADGKARVSNGICPGCVKTHFPNLMTRYLEERQCNVIVVAGSVSVSSVREMGKKQSVLSAAVAGLPRYSRAGMRRRPRFPGKLRLIG